MKIITIFLIPFFAFNLFFSIPETIQVPDGIFLALKSGNSKELAKYFNANIELQIIDKENVYSKAQAELILKDFFTKNSPNGFTKIHEGGKEGSKYVIGNLATSTGTYRVYFLLKESNSVSLIHELRIENE
ncbi:MAG: DUF4783 domain-containing protein [Bacteroidota bacterium]